MLSVFSSYSSALDLSSFEKTCSELGFKKKTQLFGECVLELNQREKNSIAKKNNDLNKIGTDNNTKISSCESFGFQRGTSQYAQCQMQIEIAKNELLQKQKQFEFEKSKFEEKQRDYDEKLLSFEQEKERREGIAWLQLGAALFSNGNTREYLINSARQTIGLPPIPPTAPESQNFTVTNPFGKMMTCSVTQSTIDCF
jgi:hypothetical protein